MSKVSFTIGEKNTLEDWGLKCLSYEITFPDKQNELLQVPGRDGKLDMSLPQQREAFGNRQIKIKCDLLDKSFSEWSDVISDIANHVQGEYLPITASFDNEWHYEGWVKFAPSKNYMVSSQMVFTIDAYPYKLKKKKTSITVKVTNSCDVILQNKKMKTEPMITTDANISVIIGDDEYMYSAGTSKAGFLLPAGETLVTIVGNANVTIQYQEGSL